MKGMFSMKLDVGTVGELMLWSQYSKKSPGSRKHVTSGQRNTFDHSLLGHSQLWSMTQVRKDVFVKAIRTICRQALPLSDVGWVHRPSWEGHSEWGLQPVENNSKVRKQGCEKHKRTLICRCQRGSTSVPSEKLSFTSVSVWEAPTGGHCHAFSICHN